MNRSLACAKPGNCPDAKRGRSVRTNGTLHSRLKITSSIRRQSHQQVRPEPGLHVRELRRERRTTKHRELPQPLPGVPVLQACRHRSRRPGLGLPRTDAPRAYRAPQRQGTRACPPVRRLRIHPTQQDRRRPTARRRHRRDHRADVRSRVVAYAATAASQEAGGRRAVACVTRCRRTGSPRARSPTARAGCRHSRPSPAARAAGSPRQPQGSRAS